MSKVLTVNGISYGNSESRLMADLIDSRYDLAEKNKNMNIYKVYSINNKMLTV